MPYTVRYIEELRHSEMIHSFRTTSTPNTEQSPSNYTERLYTFRDWAAPEVSIVYRRIKATGRACRIRRVRTSTGIKKKRFCRTYTYWKKTPSLVTTYPKVTLPLVQWCYKLSLANDESLGLYYNPHERSLVDYVHMRIGAQCKRMKSKNIIHADWHDVHHTRRRSSDINLSDYNPDPVGAVGQWCTNIFGGPADYPSVSQHGTMSGFSESARFYKYKSSSVASTFWSTNIDSIVNEIWPSMDNLQTLTTGAELIAEGMPIDGTKKYLGSDPIRLRDVASSEWLRWNFGIAPLVGAVNDLANAIKVQDSAVEQWNKSYVNDTWIDGKGYQVYQDSISFETGGVPMEITSKKVVTGSSPNINIYCKAVFTDYVGSVKLRYKAGYISSIGQIALMANYLSSDLPSLAWELTPFSWLYDYFNTFQKQASDRNNRTLAPVTTAQVVFSHKQVAEFETEFHVTGPTVVGVWEFDPWDWYGRDRYILKCEGANKLKIRGPYYDDYKEYHRWVKSYSSMPAFTATEPWIDKTRPLAISQELNIAAIVAMVSTI